jgi:hypothetical protein
VPEQRNFAVDFEVAAEIHTISDLRITVNSAWPIRSCLLYVQRRILQAASPRLQAPPEPPLPPPVRPLPQPAPFRSTQEPELEPQPRPRVRDRISPVETRQGDSPSQDPPDSTPPVKRRILN